MADTSFTTFRPTLSDPGIYTPDLEPIYLVYYGTNQGVHMFPDVGLRAQIYRACLTLDKAKQVAEECWQQRYANRNGKPFERREPRYGNEVFTMRRKNRAMEAKVWVERVKWA